MFLVPVLSKTVCLLPRVSMSVQSLGLDLGCGFLFCFVGFFFHRMCIVSALPWGLGVEWHIKYIHIYFMYGSCDIIAFVQVVWQMSFHHEENELRVLEWLKTFVGLVWSLTGIWLYFSPSGPEFYAVTKQLICQLSAFCSGFEIGGLLWLIPALAIQENTFCSTDKIFHLTYYFWQPVCSKAIYFNKITLLLYLILDTM